MQLIRDTSPCRSLAIEVRVCYTEYPFGKSAFVEVITLALYEPKYEGLWFRQMMLADEIPCPTIVHGVGQFPGRKINPRLSV